MGEGVEGVPNECTAPPAGRSEKVVEKLVGVQAGWSALCPLTPCFGAELEVSLSTEQEEKRLLREHVVALEVGSQASHRFNRLGFSQSDL